MQSFKIQNAGLNFQKSAKFMETLMLNNKVRCVNVQLRIGL